MPRYLFGLASSDLAMEAEGTELRLRPGAVGTVWDAFAGGSQVTDLLDLTSTPVTTVVADAEARVGFYGPNDAVSLWVDFGWGRFSLDANGLGTLVGSKLDKAGGTVTGNLDVNGALDVGGVVNLDAALASSSSISAVGGIESDAYLEGPTVRGGVASGGSVTIQSTSHATKGSVTIDGKLVSRAPRNLQTGTAYTTVADDAFKVVERSNASANTMTIPPNVHAADDVIYGCQVGAGTTTIVAGSGMTLRAEGGLLISRGQWAEWTIRFRSATEAVVSGNLV